MGESIYIKDLAKRMINLSGKSENEIPIKYTGLRKGEKMNEQLFFKDEIITKTKIDGILSTNSKLFAPPKSEFDKMISNILLNELTIPISLFEKLLPEYKK